MRLIAKSLFREGLGEGRGKVAQTAVFDQAIYVSKSDFTNFQNCAGFAWLAKHRPELIPRETDPGTIRRIASGNEVEMLARELFHGGVHIDTWDMVEAVALTNAAIADGVTTLFQATVRTARGLLARADILTRHGDSWVLFEVKSTTSIKKEHVADAAFQTIAFTEAGFDIAETHLIHLNKDYRRAGELTPPTLLAAHNIGAKMQKIRLRTEQDITLALETLQNPDREAVCLCDMGTRNQRCPAFAHFHPNIPGGATVYDLGSISGKVLGEALARGIVNLVDWPAEIRVTARQQRQIDVLRSGEALIDRVQLRHFLDRLDYPLYFLDYETFQTAIPMFDGCGPWAQAPFQYSIQIVDADGGSREQEFLWTERRANPIPALVERLRWDVGPSGSVLVWNQGFEESRNREMAAMIPEAAEFLLEVNARMVDLMDVVRTGAWVDAAFNGSASIKKVLPVVDPELAYEHLEIGDGSTASERWFEAMLGDAAAMTDPERDAIFDHLRVYCRHDTLAMVRIWEHLHRLIGSLLPASYANMRQPGPR
ncbi:MAG: DUF2779 domain-containing protein [Chloroflexia bacterium]|nr:DUF2779 domain-containing protein [Chloroflexia bacterium]